MRLRLAAIALLAASATAAWGHHSLAAEFDQKKPVKLTGTMTKLDWRNPHAWISIDAKMADGKIEKWQCELGSPNATTRAGFYRGRKPSNVTEPAAGFPNLQP